jgi:BirA family biotin operon repressor/biotin-[acetyl-CoA-carboxylase] ligase
MNIIKLNAIASTNDFLKELSAKQIVQNLTTVVAENQLKGKGQRGATWNSEDGKNLTFSVFLNGNTIKTTSLYLINIIVPISIQEILKRYNFNTIAIKWPNDILSDNKKIGGILIENAIKSDGTVQTIIGVGLNVNQFSFENLPQAASLAMIMNREFDKEILLKNILDQLIINLNRIGDASYFWEKYNDLLFKKEIPMVFSNALNEKFMGIIKGVSENGKLLLLLEDDAIKEYDIKEIKMHY